MPSHPLRRLFIPAVLLCASTAMLGGCGGGSSSTAAAASGSTSTTLSQSTIQLPSQVQVISSK